MTPGEPSREPAVVMRGITKHFPGVLANDNVDLRVEAGEIHALLGENGAGKTTLMNILYGVYRPDSGEIWLHGDRTAIHSPQDAIRRGIGMIHQQFRLVNNHSVAENVILGLKGSFLFPDQAALKGIQDLSAKYGLKVDPQARIWQLSAGEQQRVEILKALFRGAEVLILDEPTSMLTPGEIQDLLATLRRMTQEGNTVIFITHKLEEVIAISDRVTVLRQGKVAATLETSHTDEAELARLMVGREVLFRVEKPPGVFGDVVLDVKGLSALNDKGLPALRDVTFQIREGEILGIAGVAGNGQRELVEVLTGLRPVTTGRIHLTGQDVTDLPPRLRIDCGISCVPGERWTALIPGMSVAENLILKNYRHPPISQGPFLNHRAISAYTQQLIGEYSVLTPTKETPIKLLSGGNIQRALLAREISTHPVMLIAAHPTSGLDVGAIETIWQLLIEQRQQKRALLLISEDLEEIFALSDRVAVIHEGQIMGILPPDPSLLEQIGLMMAGALSLPKEKWHEGS